MKKKGLIVLSNYYKDISDNLLNSCLRTLVGSKLKVDIKIVSGALEIPTLISCNIKKNTNFLLL